MSTELRTLLQNAASVPAEPDLAHAFRRGRAMRARRRAGIGIVTVVLFATAAITAATITSPEHRVSIASKVSPTPAACTALSTTSHDVPSWAQSAHPPSGVPHLLSRERNVIAFIFGDPLRAGYERHNRKNKILWIVREPRHGQPLHVTGTLVGGRATASEPIIPANARPGEIYPSTINLSSPGCWHFVLRWNGNQANINLSYR